MFILFCALLWECAALTPELKTTLDKVVTSEKVVLFMKGTKDFPQCGFSNNVVQILKSLNAPFETINILENELLRQGLKEYSSWPTFPQLYIDGEFFGGCDIVIGKCFVSDLYVIAPYIFTASPRNIKFTVVFIVCLKFCCLKSQCSWPLALKFLKVYLLSNDLPRLKILLWVLCVKCQRTIKFNFLQHDTSIK